MAKISFDRIVPLLKEQQPANGARAVTGNNRLTIEIRQP